MWKQRFGFAVGLAVSLTIAAVIVAVVYDLPFRDPDSVAGPTYVRLPIILAIGFLTDVIPRAAFRAASVRGFGRSVLAVVHERWPMEHVRFAVIGLGSWYLTYVAFRNLKSFVPFVNPGLYDDQLDRIDRALFLGHDPADVLHNLLGTGFAAHFMSFIYIAWIVFVPASLAAALIFSRNVSGGSWYVTAVAVDWVLGVATYFILPTLGPIYARPERFDGLADTYSGHLQATMIAERAEVLQDPFATHAVQTIAAFASLHVGLLMTACLIAHLLRLNVWVRWALWLFLFLTVLSTIYLGWHYLVDAFGGAALGAVAVWIGAIATGNGLRRPTEEPAVELDAKAPAAVVD